MSNAENYLLNKASAAQIAEHLLGCDVDFVPPLSGRVEINDYARKIASKATRFEAWSGGTLVGLIAAYCNDQESRIAFITIASVLRAWRGKGIAVRLMSQCIEHMKASGMRQISLKVGRDNTPAIKLYKKSGFEISNTGTPSITMNYSVSYSRELQ